MMEEEALTTPVGGRVTSTGRGTVVAERPILFSAPMVRAILAGTKTQTRRVVKDKPPSGYSVGDMEEHPKYPGEWFWWLDGGDRSMSFHCPHGEPGDRLWVRETWSKSALGVYPCPPCWYRADFSSSEDPALNGEEHERGCSGNRADCFGCVAEREGEFRWRPSIFMPRRLSRITLEVTEVRAERLQGISLADVFAELGMTKAWAAQNKGESWEPYDAFADLWDGINGERPGCAWASNPWVWVVEFRTLRNP